MRTTVVLEDDVAAAVAKLRRDESLGLSEAVNRLIRLGLRAKQKRKPFRQKSQPMGLKIDITDIPRALEQLEGPYHR